MFLVISLLCVSNRDGDKSTLKLNATVFTIQSEAIKVPNFTFKKYKVFRILFVFFQLFRLKKRLIFLQSFIQSSVARFPSDGLNEQLTTHVQLFEATV